MRILNRLARLDEVEPDALAVGPLVQRLPHHLRLNVQDNFGGQPIGFRQAVKDTNDTVPM